jgi:hypothetical protein
MDNNELTYSNNRAEQSRRPDPELLTKRPYPLIHFTDPGIAARIINSGIFSKTEAARMGIVLHEKARFQTEQSVCVTDLESLITAENTPNPANLAGSVLGIIGYPEINTYHDGGIAILINPDIPREHDSGGHMRGEAVVEATIPPQEIMGVVLSKHFQDADILSSVSQKLNELDFQQPILVIQKFNEEICILLARDSLSKDLYQQIVACNQQELDFRILGAPIINPNSIYNLIKKNRNNPGIINIDQQNSELDRLMLEFDEKTARFNRIATDANRKAQINHVLMQIYQLLESEIRQMNVSTYKELLIQFAQKKQIPMYDQAGILIV